jgi:hypothetical protein
VKTLRDWSAGQKNSLFHADVYSLTNTYVEAHEGGYVEALNVDSTDETWCQLTVEIIDTGRLERVIASQKELAR